MRVERKKKKRKPLFDINYTYIHIYIYIYIYMKLWNLIKHAIEIIKRYEVVIGGHKV